MANKSRWSSFILIRSFFFEYFPLILIIRSFFSGALADPQVPCYYIFGDSLVDNGNNNAMASLARANYLPYGIDFPDGPSGRFTNGLTTVDVIGMFIFY